MNDPRQQYQQFFFGNVPQQQPTQHPNMIYNLQVLEIANNWEYIKETLEKCKKNELKQLNIIQVDCLKFIMNNMINLNSYDNEDDFIKLTLRSLA